MNKIVQTLVQNAINDQLNCAIPFNLLLCKPLCMQILCEIMYKIYNIDCKAQRPSVGSMAGNDRTPDHDDPTRSESASATATGPAESGHDHNHEMPVTHDQGL